MADHGLLVTGGVDTHKDTHVAAALDQLGRVLGTCQRSAGCPRWRPRGFPMSGHEDSPRAAVVFPGCGGVRSGGQGVTPFAAGGIREADGFAFGEDEVGVVHEPVDERGGDGAVHELVEPGGVQVRRHGD